MGRDIRSVFGRVRETSRFFDGNGGQSFYNIESVIVGAEQGITTRGIGDEEASSPESLGRQDDRTSSFDDRIARIMPVGCTAFSLNNGVFLTAGHCVTEGMLVLEFRVPQSLSNGAPVPPLVEHQFRVSPASILYSAKGPGRDWAVFSVHENDDGLTPHPRTLSHRRTNGGRLTVYESDRAARVARGLAVAERTFANREKAARWLHRNLGALGGRTPMDLIRTDAGARVVEGLLARISWGAAA